MDICSVTSLIVLIAAVVLLVAASASALARLHQARKVYEAAEAYLEGAYDSYTEAQKVLREAEVRAEEADLLLSGALDLEAEEEGMRQ